MESGLSSLGDSEVDMEMPSEDGSAASSSLLWLERQRLTRELHEHPYDLVRHLERAIIHSDLGYPDLAAGDAYRALLLCDEVGDESFEYHTQAVEALTERFDQKHSVVMHRENPVAVNLASDMEKLNIASDDMFTKVQQMAEQATLRCFHILSMSLLLCGSLKSALHFCKRGLNLAPDDEGLHQTNEYIMDLAKRRLKVDHVDPSDIPDQGLVRREIYPWNQHEPDRFSQASLDHLNGELIKIAPKCEVKATELPTLVEALKDGQISGPHFNKQLGVFATADIAAGESVLKEYTVLTATNRLKDAVCDACSTKLPPFGPDMTVVSCPDCTDTMFCNEECLAQAQSLYHPAVCDKDDLDSVARDPTPQETPSALYVLLLSRALAMAATQDVHPLELREVKYIWGDFLPSRSNDIPLSLPIDAEPPPVWTLPFSFASNIATPLHILEKMDIDIFATLPRFDFWIFNTLYAKFRGTASARVDPRSGHPEVAAVHSLWCLANHDCAPNVRWNWDGRMELFCRETRIGGGAGGIRKGDEILNHYCDVDLKVADRREWARGSLGGDCQCERCRKEAGETQDTTGGA